MLQLSGADEVVKDRLLVPDECIERRLEPHKPIREFVKTSQRHLRSCRPLVRLSRSPAFATDPIAGRDASTHR